MFKYTLPAVFLTFACPAQADITPLQMQYTLPTGFSNQWSDGLGTGGCLQPGQCFPIPAGKRLLGCTGTQTIKVNGIELLARIVAGNPSGWYMPIWTGHHLSTSPTVRIDTPIVPPDGNFYGDGTNKIWIEFQASNQGGGTQPGGGWEMQANCSFQ